ncbi:MAG TPA: Hsp20/alpha crystallin family protein [Chloroflexota bacterium]|nr:Hsp20/alpha crystallin family protein [Chloroflexota bacterium]
MRYRRLSYRYAIVVTSSEPRPFGDARRSDQMGVRLAQFCWRPPADVYETATGIAVTVDLAGVDEDDLEMLLFEDALVIEGQRRLPPGEAGGVYHAAEIRQGQFRLELPLPVSIDSEGVHASYESGILKVILPKSRTGGKSNGG